MKHGGAICLYAIFKFLTISNAANLLGIYDEQTFIQRYAVDPVLNYDSHERVWPPRLLRQGEVKQPPTNATIAGTTSGTTIENAYIPYWPHGEWIFENGYKFFGYRNYCPNIVAQYGEVCGRRMDMRFNWPHQYKTFVNLCEMDKWNWREGSDKTLDSVVRGYGGNCNCTLLQRSGRFYPVHMRKCRNEGAWSQQVTEHDALTARKRKFALLLAQRLNATTTRLVNING